MIEVTSQLAYKMVLYRVKQDEAPIFIGQLNLSVLYY